MRHGKILLLLSVFSFASACNAPAIEGSLPNGATPFPSTGDGGPAGGPAFDPDSRGPLDGGAGFDGSMQDSDGDGAPDFFDCDPTSTKVGGYVLEDDLATAKGLIEAAPGFDPAAWTHGQGGYQQNALRNAGDASFFKIETLPGDLEVSVRAISTKTGMFKPTLHQDFIVIGANAGGGQFNALGCGVEFVEGNNPMGVVSIVALSGSVGAIRTTPLQRTARPFLPANEEFGITAKVDAGVITCTVQQKQGSTSVNAKVGPVQGAVGFYTHQAAALFRAARICQINASGGPPNRPSGPANN